MKGIKISGYIFNSEGDMNHDEFLDAFIEFVESKGWEFGGGTDLVDDNENRPMKN